MSIRIGFIGCGSFANAHMNVLQRIEDVALVAFSDIQKDRADAAAARFNGASYADYHEMLDRETLDAAYIVVPPFAHHDQEIIAARKGIHLFIEKPVAATMDKAREIRDAVHENGVITSVGYIWRWYSSTERAKALLAGRDIGMMLGYFMGGLPGVSWWRVMAESGGQMVEQTTHIFDLARHLAGEIVEVYAASSLRALKDVPNLDVPDVGTAALKFESGAVGTISNTCILSQGYQVGLHVVCKDLVLEINLDRSLKVIEPGRTEILANTTDPLMAEDQAFINAVKTGDKSGIRSTYCDAVRTLAVTLAANESAITGKPVQLMVDS